MKRAATPVDSSVASAGGNRAPKGRSRAVNESFAAAMNQNSMAGRGTEGKAAKVEPGWAGDGARALGKGGGADGASRTSAEVAGENAGGARRSAGERGWGEKA